MKIKRIDPRTAEIPTASLGDIAFLLIIFFMTTTTYGAKKGIFFQLPKEQTSVDVEEVRAVHIKIEADGQIIMDGAPAQLSDIQPYIHPKLLRNPNKFVIVETDPDAMYGWMIDVLDELKQIKDPELKNIAVPTREEIASWGKQ